jgi:hypothetical protein
MGNDRTYTFDEIVVSDLGGIHPDGFMVWSGRVIRCEVRSEGGRLYPVWPEAVSERLEPVSLGDEIHFIKVGTLGTEGVEPLEGFDDEGEYVILEGWPTEGWRHQSDCPCDECYHERPEEAS